jgi:hypothetical protein
MTLDNLFDDLESQLERELDAQLQNRLDDEERERQCALSLRDRLVALTRQQEVGELTIVMRDGVTMKLLPQRVGKDWFLAEIREPQDFLGMAICSIASIRQLRLSPEQNRVSLGETVGELSRADLDSLSTRGGLTAQVSFAFVLRDVGRRRKQIEVVTAQARFLGTIDRVGADHMEISGEEATLLPLADVLYVRVM